MIHNDLRQHHACKVLSRGAVDHLDFNALAHHRRNVFQIHVAAVLGIVQAPVFVFSDQPLFRLHERAFPLDNPQGGRRMKLCCSAA